MDRLKIYFQKNKVGGKTIKDVDIVVAWYAELNHIKTLKKC